MTRLLDDLLDVSRITNKLELRKERIELAVLVQSAVETSRPLIDSGGQELTIALPHQPFTSMPTPFAGSGFLETCSAMPPSISEPGGHIRLTGECQGTDVVVSVKDDGMGIAAEILPASSTFFSQAIEALERSQGGLGIGLSLGERSGRAPWRHD